MTCLTLIRGLPGSGKSTLAAKLAKQTGAYHLEADQYFIDGNGHYRFSARQLKDAHLWCQQQTELKLKQQDVVVANTFVEHWEMLAYKRIAIAQAADFCVLVCRGSYANQHQVPPATLASMRRRWQD
ncbi:ATP-binding protein [Gayadomonas joobiniege]|uniref:ATP-binding protein n=1 Tax=Gayadomonas joobiniege TaxID=1234606 RepID=UPI00036C83E8|nr:ATP-binding protein [Gayadomonas joobiniege]